MSDCFDPAAEKADFPPAAPPRKRPGRGDPAAKGNGTGYGGPAKGQGSAAPMPPPFTPDTQPAPEAKSAGQQRRVALLDRLYKIGMGEQDAQPVNVSAIQAYMDRTEGKPVSTQVNVSSNDLAGMSDDDIRSELARYSGTRA